MTYSLTNSSDASKPPIPPSIVQDSGQLEKQRVAKWKTPFFNVLIVIGVLGLVASVIGFISFGSHKGWWSSGNLHKFSKQNSIILMSTAGSGGLLFFVGGIIGLTLNKNTGGQPSEVASIQRSDNTKKSDNAVSPSLATPNLLEENHVVAVPPSAPKVTNKLKSLFAFYLGSPSSNAFHIKMPEVVLTHTLTFLNTQDLNNFRLVNKYANKCSKIVLKKNVIRGEWFPLNDERFWHGEMIKGKHWVYLKLDDSKKQVETFFVDKHYSNRKVLSNTYYFLIEICAVKEKELYKIRFTTPCVFWVEAREFRGNTLADWGEYLDEDESSKMRGIFYDFFCKPTTSSAS